MECPYCKKEMAKGTVSSARDDLCWYPEDTPMEGVVTLAKMSFLTPADATAYYCEDCRMVLVPVPEKIEGPMDKLKKKWNDISDKIETASEARQARQEEERKEKQREKRGKKDPWER